MRLPFKLTLPLRKHFAFIVQHRYIDETLGRVLLPGGVTKYPGAYHDTAMDASFAYTAGTSTWSVGYFRRHRVCCPYDKADEHLPYLGFEDDFGPKVGAKTMFQFVLRGLRSAGHKGPGGNLFLYRTSLQARIPVDKTLNVLAKAGIDSDYFDGNPVPFYYNYVNLGAEALFSPNVTYTILVENLTQRNQGYPFAYPNTIHRAKLVLRADFKVPF